MTGVSGEMHDMPHVSEQRVEEREDQQKKQEVVEEEVKTGKTSDGRSVTVMKKDTAEAGNPKPIEVASTKLKGLASELKLGSDVEFKFIQKGGDVKVLFGKNGAPPRHNFGSYVTRNRETIQNQINGLKAEQSRLTKMQGSIVGPPDDPKVAASKEKISAKLTEINNSLQALEPKLADANHRVSLLQNVLAQYNESVKGEKKPEPNLEQEALAVFSGSQSSSSAVSSDSRTSDASAAAAPANPSGAAQLQSLRDRASSPEDYSLMPAPTAKDAGEAAPTAPKQGVRFADEAGKDLEEVRGYVKGSAPNPAEAAGAKQLKSLGERGPVTPDTRAGIQAQAEGAKNLQNLRGRQPVSDETRVQVRADIRHEKGAEQLQSLHGRQAITPETGKEIQETARQEAAKKSEKADGQASQVMMECLSTETAYKNAISETANRLKHVSNNYKGPLKGRVEGMLKDFSQLEKSIATVEEGMAEALKKPTVDEQRSAFAKLYTSPEFTVYQALTRKCASYQKEMLRLTEGDPQLAKSFESAKIAVGNQDMSLQGQNINSLLIKTVQRPPRHMLLMREILKNTPTSSPSYEAVSNAFKLTEQNVGKFDLQMQQSNELDFIDEINSGPKLSAEKFKDILLQKLFEPNPQALRMSQPKNIATFLKVLGDKTGDPGQSIQGMKLFMEEMKNVGILPGGDPEVVKKNEDKKKFMLDVMAHNPGVMDGLFSEMGNLTAAASAKEHEKFLGFFSLGNAAKSQTMLKDLSDLRGQLRGLEDTVAAERAEMKQSSIESEKRKKAA